MHPMPKEHACGGMGELVNRRAEPSGEPHDGGRAEDRRQHARREDVELVECERARKRWRHENDQVERADAKSVDYLQRSSSSSRS